MDKLCDTAANLRDRPSPERMPAARQVNGSRSFFLFGVLTRVIMQMGTHAFILHCYKQNKHR